MPEGRRRVSEGRYRITELDCKRTELAVEIPDDSNAPLRTMELGAYPFLDDIVLRKDGGRLVGETLPGVGGGKGESLLAG